jgi:hypothetical protein
MGKRDVEKESFMGSDWAVKAFQWYQNKRLQKNVSTRRRRNRTNHRRTLPEDPCSLSCRECGRTRYPMSWGSSYRLLLAVLRNVRT